MITTVKDRYPGALTGESGLRNLSNRMISAAPVKTLISQRCHRPKKLLEPWVRHPWSCCQDRLSRAGQQHHVGMEGHFCRPVRLEGHLLFLG